MGEERVALAHGRKNWRVQSTFERFATLIEKHWDGIVRILLLSPSTKPSFTLLRGSQYATIQRRAYGYRDKDYLRLLLMF